MLFVNSDWESEILITNWLLRLQDWRCLWCRATVHTACRPNHTEVCPLGPSRVSVVPPTALHSIGKLSLLSLEDWRCLWSQNTIHTICCPNNMEVCPLGPSRIRVVPPTALHSIGNLSLPRLQDWRYMQCWASMHSTCHSNHMEVCCEVLIMSMLYLLQHCSEPQLSHFRLSDSSDYSTIHIYSTPNHVSIDS